MIKKILGQAAFLLGKFHNRFMEEKYKNRKVINLGRQEAKSLKVWQLTNLINNNCTNELSYKKVHKFKQAVWNFVQRKISSTNPGQI